MGYFLVHRRGEACYYPVLVTMIGDVILRGTECSNSPLACETSINLIRSLATDFSNYDLKESLHGKYFFEISDANGKTVAQSALFENEDTVFSSIELVIRMIPEAVVDEQLFPHYALNDR